MIRRNLRALTPGLIASCVLHSAVLGSALVSWGLGDPSPRAAAVVLVDLSPSDTTPAAAGRPADLPEAGPPAEEAASRLAALDEQNSELAARLEAEQQRTAQLETDHRREIAALETAKHRLGEEVAALAADVEAERERRAVAERELASRRRAEQAAQDELVATQERLVRTLGPEIASDTVAIERAGGSLTVAIVDRVLFPSGQATLTPAGQAVIDRVGEALRQVDRRPILIEGHTDDVPIGRVLAPRFPSNWELSAARASEVVKRLIDHADLAAERLRAVGRADTEPVASNDTEDGRRLNRRIEIILLPPPAAGHVS